MSQEEKENLREKLKVAKETLEIIAKTDRLPLTDMVDTETEQLRDVRHALRAVSFRAKETLKKIRGE